MFRPIRRKKNELGAEASKMLLTTERRGVLALNGEDGYPYAIPVNYWYCEEENRIFFHGAKAGYKAELIQKDEKVCFTVFGHETVREEAWAPFLQSVVAFGKCSVVDDPERKNLLLQSFAGKYYPCTDLIEKEISVSGKNAQMFEIVIEHMSGKEIQER